MTSLLEQNPIEVVAPGIAVELEILGKNLLNSAGSGITKSEATGLKNLLSII